jgi:hypothetical protein
MEFYFSYFFLTVPMAGIELLILGLWVEWSTSVLISSLPDLCGNSFTWIFMLAIFFLPVPVAGIEPLILGLWVK